MLHMRCISGVEKLLRDDGRGYGTVLGLERFAYIQTLLIHQGLFATMMRSSYSYSTKL